MNRKVIFLLGLLGLLLLLTAAWSWQYMSARRAEAARAENDLADGLRMLSRIEQLSSRPKPVAERERLVTETVSLIEDAAASAGIPAESRRRIAGETPRRLGDSVYKEKPTRVVLQPVTLKQLVDFAWALSSRNDGLNVDSIRLSTPRDSDAGDRWTVELVLTYLIYEPPQAGR